jgi:disulfide bond formation protein DsbB
LQRYCLIAVVLASLVSGAFKGRTSVGLLTLAGVAALGGIAFATRQVYLQSMPETGTACGPGFEYIVNSFPLTDMLPLLFRGTGDCAHVDWIWHGVTIPKLSLFAFVGFAVLLGLVLGARLRK